MLIFIRELARNKKALIIWSIGMALFSVFIMTFFPTIVEQAETLDELMQKYPSELVEAFNFNRLSMADPMGFYGTQIYLFITLFGSIYSMLLFSSVVSREENEKTSEFINTRPVKRNKIFASKIIAAFVNITVFNASFGIVNLVLFEIYASGSYDRHTLYLLITAPWLMHILFGSVGIFISVFIIKARTLYPLSIGIVLVSYFINVVSNLAEKGKNLRYLTPFKYFDAADIIDAGAFSTAYLAIMLCVVSFSVSAAFFLYSRKDLAA